MLRDAIVATCHTVLWHMLLWCDCVDSGCFGVGEQTCQFRLFEQTCVFCFAWLWFGSASVCVASGTRVRRARVMDEATRFAAWTKEGRGDMPPPEEALAKELLELFKNGDIVLSSVVTKATVIPKEDLRELWSAVWTDVDVMRQAAGDKAMPSSRRQRYVLWALLPTTVFDVTRDGSTPDKKRPPDTTPSAPAEAGGFGR